MNYAMIKFIILYTSLILLFSLASLSEVAAQNKDAGPDKYPVCTNLAEVKQAMGYPKDAAKQGIEGKVMLKVLVDKSGKVSESKIVEGAPKLLAESVEKHVSSLEFTAGEKNGKAVSTWMTLPFMFKLGK